MKSNGEDIPQERMTDITGLSPEDEQENIDLEQEQEESENGMFEHFRFNVDRGQEMLRIDKYLTAHLEGTSRHRVQLALDADYVRVNGRPTKASYRVKPLDLITISLPYRRHSLEILPEEMPLDIRYEDDDLMVINKPAGLVVHPGHGHYTGTLLNGLAWYLGRTQKEDDSDDRMGILVHRIDKDTSGTLLVAKNDDAQMHLARQFFYHTIDRRYTAIVWGDMEGSEGTVDANIGRDPNDRIRYKVVDDACGKRAVTHWRVLQRLGYVTVVECRLETGRTHQIRVHMNHIGHPLFNDSLYGGDRILKGTLYSKYRQFIDNCFTVLPRQGLHARTLGFEHPRTHEHIFVESELPEDMVGLIRKFETFVSSRH